MQNIQESIDRNAMEAKAAVDIDQEERPAAGSFRLESPLGEADSELSIKDGVPAPNVVGHPLGPGSLTLIDSLEENRRQKAIRSPPRGFSVAGYETHSTTARVLPKALQPKELRQSSKPMVPTSTVSGSGRNLLSSGVDVSYCVKNQKRHSNTTSGFATLLRNTASSASSMGFSKPEVVFRQPAIGKGSSASSRRVVNEPNPGLITLRAAQRHRATDCRTNSQEVEIPEDTRSESLSGIVALIQSPYITSARTRSTGDTQTAPTYSEFNKLMFEVDESQSPDADEPILDSVSGSNSVFDPSPTTAEQKTLTGEQRLETDDPDPELLPVTPGPDIRINRDSVASPIENEEAGDAAASDAVHSERSHSRTSSDVEIRVGQSEDYDERSDPSACSEEVALKIAEGTAGDETVEDVDAVPLELNPDADDWVPPLPALPPPRIYIPLDFDEDCDDDDYYSLSPSGFYHRASGSNITDDSGLECLTPRDYSSAEEPDQEHHQRHDDGGLLLSPCPPSRMVRPGGSRSVTHTSVKTDSALEDLRAEQHNIGCFQTPRAKPLEDFRSQEDNITTSGSVLAGGFPLLDCVHNDSDHPATRTSLTAAMLDCPAVVGPNKLPVCSSEVVTSDKLTTGNVEASDECSEKEETTKNDDVIRTCVTESGDAAVCVVEVEKGELGLGFCLQGGKGSVAGDRPLSVKKLFRGNPTLVGDLRVGDQILSVNGEDFTQMSHYVAWNRLKAIPVGPLSIAVRRRP